jgi:hypothetical protein
MTSLVIIPIVQYKQIIYAKSRRIEISLPYSSSLSPTVSCLPLLLSAKLPVKQIVPARTVTLTHRAFGIRNPSLFLAWITPHSEVSLDFWIIWCLIASSYAPSKSVWRIATRTHLSQP